MANSPVRSENASQLPDLRFVAEAKGLSSRIAVPFGLLLKQSLALPNKGKAIRYNLFNSSKFADMDGNRGFSDAYIPILTEMRWSLSARASNAAGLSVDSRTLWSPYQNRWQSPGLKSGGHGFSHNWSQDDQYDGASARFQKASER